MSVRLQLLTPAILKYQFGTVQITLNSASTVAELLRGIQLSIAKQDLRGKGKEEQFHVTVKYGIKDAVLNDSSIKYLANISPFSIVLGETKIFPATINSDNNSVVYVEIISPELRKINKELTSIGNFKIDDFDYNPHLTLAYVSPDSAYKYDGLTGVSGFNYLVDNIEVRSKDKEAPPQVLQFSIPIIAKFGKLSVYIPHPKLRK